MGDLTRAIKKGISEANKTKRKGRRRKKEEVGGFEAFVALFKLTLFVILFCTFTFDVFKLPHGYSRNTLRVHIPQTFPPHRRTGTAPETKPRPGTPKTTLPDPSNCQLGVLSTIIVR